MIHISRAHSISNTKYKKIKRLVRLFKKKQNGSFLDWMEKRGDLNKLDGKQGDLK